MLLQSLALTGTGMTVDAVQDLLPTLNDLLVLGEETCTSESCVARKGWQPGKTGT